MIDPISKSKEYVVDKLISLGVKLEKSLSCIKDSSIRRKLSYEEDKQLHLVRLKAIDDKSSLSKGGEDEFKGIKIRISEKLDKLEKSYTEDTITSIKEADRIKRKLRLIYRSQIIQKAVEDELQKERVGTAYDTIVEAYTQQKIDKEQLREARRNAEPRMGRQVHYSDMIVMDMMGRILLLKRSDEEEGEMAGKWGLPGGHVDPGEDHRTAAVRELHEEAMIEVEPEAARKVGELTNPKAMIEYYQVYVDYIPVVGINAREHSDYEWVLPSSLDRYELIGDLRDILNKIFYLELDPKVAEVRKAFNTVLTAYFNDKLDEQVVSDCYGIFLEKSEKGDDKKQRKVAKVLREFKEGGLKSSSGDKVTDRKQAIAIALSEARLSKSDNVRDLDFLEKRYNEWNDQGVGYKEPTESSVLEFFQNNYEDLSNDKELRNNLLSRLSKCRVDKAIKVLELACSQGRISKDVLEKAVAQVGEVRHWSDGSYKKISAGKWVKVIEGSGKEKLIASSGILKKIKEERVNLEEQYEKRKAEFESGLSSKFPKGTIQYKVFFDRAWSQEIGGNDFIKKIREEQRDLNDEVNEIVKQAELDKKIKREEVAGKKEVDFEDLNKEFVEYRGIFQSIEKEIPRFALASQVAPEVTVDDYYLDTEASFKVIEEYKPTKEEEVWINNVANRWNEMKDSGKYELTHSPKSSSQYLIDRSTGDVYRMADHWGKCASCNWDVDFKENNYGIAVCNVKDFKRKDSLGWFNPQYRIKMVEAANLVLPKLSELVRENDKQYLTDSAKERVSNFSKKILNDHLKRSAMLCEEEIKKLREKYINLFNDNFEKALEVLELAYKQGKVSLDVLEKARSHKYIRKESDGKGNFNYIYTENKNSGNDKFKEVKDYADRVIKGEEHLERLSPAEERGCIEGGRRNVEATILCSTVQGSDSTERGDVGRVGKEQTKLLEEYARKEGIWVDYYGQKKYWDFLFQGGEAKVYREDDNTVKKVVEYEASHATPLEYLDRISLHNYLFPNVSYKLVGFCSYYGELQFIVTQPLIKNSRYATPEEIKLEMEHRGFTSVGKTKFVNKDYIVEDLTSRNVLRDEQGNMFFIDGKVMLNKKITKALEILEIASSKGEITLDTLEKARTGVYADTSENRKLKRVGQRYSKEHQEDQSGGKSKVVDGDKKGSEKPLEDYAKEASGSALEQAAKEAKDPEVRTAAHQELKRRESEEQVKKDEGGEKKEGGKEDEYNSKSIEELVSLKKKLYSNMDISTPMSDDEKLLNRIIAKKFSDLNEQIRQKRKNKEVVKSDDNKVEKSVKDNNWEQWL